MTARVSRASTSLLGQAQRQASTAPPPSRFRAQPTIPSFGSQLTPQTIHAHFGKSPFAIASTNLLGNNEEIAARAMTHESFRNGRQGHNRRLAFLGRRSLKMFTSLYLFEQLQASNGAAPSEYIRKLVNSTASVDAMLVTSRLGDKVGRQLQLEKVMKWTPNVIDEGQLGPRETGLFKVRGSCVEALLGAVYHERGAHVALQFFNASILPILVREIFPKPVPGFLSQQFAT